MSAVIEAPQVQPQQRSLLVKLATKYSVEPEKMLTTLKATAFKADKGVSNEQMMALLIVADQHGLNPWTREIYAFPDKRGGIVPVVGVDGWIRIVNEHPQFDGVEFNEPEPNEKTGVPDWIECVIYRRDRSHPTRVREYFAEVRRGTDPWQSHPRRMLRHKSFIQCARVAFGFAGIYDPDEAERIIDGGISEVRANEAVADINKRLERRHAPAADLLPVGDAIDMEQAAGLDAAMASNPVEKPEVSAAPAISQAALIDKIRAALSRDQLELLGDLIRSLPVDQQDLPNEEFGRRWKALGAED